MNIQDANLAFPAGFKAPAPSENATPAQDPSAELRADALYREGLSHLQAGDWAAARAAFQKLAATHPGSEAVRRLLEETEFRARFDRQARVRPRHWIIPWGRVGLVLVIIAAVSAVIYVAALTLSRQILPGLAELRREHELSQHLADGRAFLQAGDLEAAEARFRAALALDTEAPAAFDGLEAVDGQRELAALYDEAVALEAAGQDEAALAKLTELTLRAPTYRDAPKRILLIRQKDTLRELAAAAEAAYTAGDYSASLRADEQIRALDTHYQAEQVIERMYNAHLQLGLAIIRQDPPAPERAPEARDEFAAALALRPGSAEAAAEQRLVRLFLEGQTLYYQGRYDEALARLRFLYDQNSDYMGTVLIDMLYDAYIRSGDIHLDGADPGLAYEQYRRAAELPVPDRTLARSRLDGVAAQLTPTPTPTVTPLPTSTPPPSPTPGPTAVVTPLPLAAYHNQIAFLSDQPEQSGLWVMDPTGGNRRYIDSSAAMKEYHALIEQERFSPDGRYRLIVQDTGKKAQVFILLPAEERTASSATRLLSKLTGLSYDPVWSPDGGRIAFVSQENGTDDIWLVNADGSNRHNLTRNTWEWDKHPSWSPDGARLVFWSNREGRGQIYVMDTEGHNIKNISGTEWAEYDPVWIR